MGRVSECQGLGENGKDELPPVCARCQVPLCPIDPPGGRCWLCTAEKPLPRPRRVEDVYGPAVIDYHMTTQEAREYTIAYFKDQGCLRCGLRCAPEALDFHHWYPAAKRGHVRATNEGMLELPWCIVLCAICHRIEEKARGPMWAQMRYPRKSKRDQFVEGRL